MANTSDAAGILRGIQNVLVLRRQNRAAEAKQELQSVKFQMLQRQLDLREEEHKASQAFRKSQMERDKWVRTDRGMMDITTGAILKGTEPLQKQQPSFTLGPGQERFGPTGESIASVAPTERPPQRPISVSPGGTLVDPTTGEAMFTSPERERPPISVSPGGTLVDPSTGEPMFIAPERERPPPRPISVAPGGTLVDPTTGEAMFTAPERERPPTSIVRDFDVLMEPIPEGIIPELKKVYEQRNQAILDKHSIDTKRTSVFKEKLNELKEFGPPSEEQIQRLIGTYSKKRQLAPIRADTAEVLLREFTAMLVGKSYEAGEWKNIVKELKKKKDKFTDEQETQTVADAFIAQIHALAQAMSDNQKAAFYGSASQALGQTISPASAPTAARGALPSAPAVVQPVAEQLEAHGEAAKAPPVRSTPPKSWQEILDRGEIFTDDEYQLLKKTLGEIPAELLDALTELHIWDAAHR